MRTFLLIFFIGALLGKTGYVRNRDLEFHETSGTRAEIVAQLDAAIAAARTTLAGLTEADLAAEFPLEVGGVRMRNGLFLMHLCSHAAFHLGQIDYARRLIAGDARTADTVPLKPLA